MSLEEYLKELADIHKRIVISKLSGLSNLSREEAALLEKTWPDLPPKRRRELVYHLVDLAEDNIEMDFSAIMRIALQDSESAVRDKAIEGLSEGEEPWIMDSLIRLMVGDSQVAVRAAAASALRRFALLAELEELSASRAERLERALIAAIENKSEPMEVRRRAIEAISPLSGPKVKEIIQEAYESDDAKMRASALFSMGQNCDPKWLPILLRELSNSDPEMRFEAAAACGEIGDKEAVPALLRLLQDEDMEVRLAAICALGQIGAPEAKQALLRRLEDPDERIRAMAEDALDEIAFNENPLSFGM